MLYFFGVSWTTHGAVPCASSGGYPTDSHNVPIRQKCCRKLGQYQLILVDSL